MQKHIGKAAAKLVKAPLKTTRPRFKHEATPEKFTYALAAYTAERRKDGWYICKSVPSFANERLPRSPPSNRARRELSK